MTTTTTTTMIEPGYYILQTRTKDIKQSLRGHISLSLSFTFAMFNGLNLHSDLN